MANQTAIDCKEGINLRWPTEPKVEIIERIARDKLHIDPKETCDVTFFTSGPFSKIYKIEAKGSCCLMKVTRPVDPTYKTKSEVATSEFVRNYTNIPVAAVYAWEASSDNELGFEWILMDVIQGQKLGSVWRKLPLITKEELAKTLASYQAQLYRLKFEGIGSLQARLLKSELQAGIENETQINPHTTHKDGEILGIELNMDRIVSSAFIQDASINLDAQQGPFSNSKDWLLYLLTIVVRQEENEMKGLADKEEVEEKQYIIATAEILIEALPRFFPLEDSTEHTHLFHEDLSLQNIFVDDFGRITGVTGWDFVSALPLWRACQLPELFDLIDRHRSQEPSQDEYEGKPIDKETAGSEVEGTKAGLSDNEEGNSDEGKSEEVRKPHIYWEHLMEYERTRMRQVFIKEMVKLEPDWVAHMNTSKVKYDFYLAIMWLFTGRFSNVIRKWVDAFDDGMVTNLYSHLPTDA